MQAYFELEQAFSISMPQLVFEILIAYKKNMQCNGYDCGFSFESYG